MSRYAPRKSAPSGPSYLTHGSLDPKSSHPNSLIPRHGPDRTRPDKVRGLCRRPGSGRARVVEFSYNGTSIGSSVVVGLAIVTKRQTHKPHYIGNNRPRSHALRAMLPKRFFFKFRVFIFWRKKTKTYTYSFREHLFRVIFSARSRLLSLLPASRTTRRSSHSE